MVTLSFKEDSSSLLIELAIISNSYDNTLPTNEFFYIWKQDNIATSPVEKKHKPNIQIIHFVWSSKLKGSTPEVFF